MPVIRDEKQAQHPVLKLSEKEHFKGALHCKGALLPIASMEASTAQQTSSWGNPAGILKCKILGTETTRCVRL